MLRMLSFFLLISGAVQAQNAKTPESVQEKKIQTLVRKMTLEEGGKFSIKNSGSKFGGEVCSVMRPTKS